MNSEQFHQQQTEQQRLESGEPDYGNCDGCGYTHPVLVNAWTVEGFRLRFGDAAVKAMESRVGGHLPGAGEADLYDIDRIALCHECEYHPENWNE